MRPGDLEVHIEELMIDGASGIDAADLGPAVERELGRLFSEGGLPPSLARGGAVAQVDGGSIELPAEGGTSGLGARIAGGVYGSLKP